MCAAGEAVPADEGRRIQCIEVRNIVLPRNIVSYPDSNLKSVPGQRYCYREKVGDPSAWAGHRAYTLVRIPSCDAWAFRMSIADCLVDPV
jgi:hypothetical protein